MKIASVDLPTPFAVAPMAGMTDTAFRRLVKRHGGCGLVVTEMVSSEAWYAASTGPSSTPSTPRKSGRSRFRCSAAIPRKWPAAAQIVEGMGADIVDVNMGCPVPKIAKHNAGCSLMREPAHAASVIAAMTKAVKIPVTVKMRAGWNEEERNAPDAGPDGGGRRGVGGRRARPDRCAELHGSADWDLVARIADELTIPVFGSGDCLEPEHVMSRMRSGVEGVLVGRGVLRNPWILAQAADLAAGRPMRQVTLADRGQFLLDYIDLLMNERVREPEGFRPRRGKLTAGASRRRTTSGSSTKCARSVPGTPRAWTTGRTCEPRSTVPTPSARPARHDSRAFFCAAARSDSASEPAAWPIHCRCALHFWRGAVPQPVPAGRAPRTSASNRSTTRPPAASRR